MPCYDSRSDHSVEYRDSPEQQRKINFLTRKLCHACSLLESNAIIMGTELGNWYENHQQEDAARERKAKKKLDQETARKNRAEYLASVKDRLVNQLSQDEKEALGL